MGTQNSGKIPAAPRAKQYESDVVTGKRVRVRKVKRTDKRGK